MKNKYKNIIIVSLFVIASISIFLMYKSLNNKNIKLDEVKLKEMVKSQNSMFAIMLEQQDGSYLASDSNAWPTEGYSYNSTKSGCVDNDGNKVEGALDFNNNTKIATVSGNSSLHCYLYFDILAIMELYVNQGSQDIDIGDEVSIHKSNSFDEHFYVVSSNSSETVLIAKYNLYVGDIVNYENFNWTYINSLSPSDSGYGLQSVNAKGTVDGNGQYVGVVPFSGTNYWDDSVCQYTGTSWGCTGAQGLKSEYATGGASYSGSLYPNVYNSSMSNIAPSLNYGNGYGAAQNNGYTIAYYIEEYINTLGINGTGRLLTYEEEQSLESSNSSIVFNNQSYWLGSAYHSSSVWHVTSDGRVDYSTCAFGGSRGVRPVIIVSTDDIVLN